MQRQSSVCLIEGPVPSQASQNGISGGHSGSETDFYPITSVSLSLLFPNAPLLVFDKSSIDTSKHEQLLLSIYLIRNFNVLLTPRKMLD
jgi:hypothetical protein